MKKYKKGGITQKEVSDTFGISSRTFRRWLRQYNETKSLDRKGRSYESYKIKQKHVNYAIKILEKNQIFSIQRILTIVKRKYPDCEVTSYHLGRVIRENNITRKRTTIRHFPETRYGKNINLKLEMKTLTVFQKMDLCGYNTDISWFLNLTQHLCIRYLKSLLDIWEYRSQIDEETKHKIYPGGNPFYRFNYIRQPIDQINDRIHNTISFKNDILSLIDDLITKGQDDSFRNMGMIYVLGAFTIVNHNAAASLPWLYETFSLTH